QWVERNPAKVEVASSGLVSRSIFRGEVARPSLFAFWRDGRRVMQRIANPSMPVRVRLPPPVCPGGETGRHRGLKIPCPKGRAGSSPAPGTSKRHPVVESATGKAGSCDIRGRGGLAYSKSLRQ